MEASIQALSNATTASQGESTNSTHMENAKDFVLNLLQRHYHSLPEFIIRPSTLGPMSKYGMKMVSKAADSSKPGSAPSTASAGNRAKPLNKRHIHNLKMRKYRRDFLYCLRLKSHSIDAENIAAFEVLRRCTPNTPPDALFFQNYTGTSATLKGTYRLHTIVAIVLDESNHFGQSTGKDNVHRGDLLTDALCHSGQIQSGYGILLNGSQLEVYDFENGAPTRIEGPETIVEEPYVTLSKGTDGKDMVVDAREGLKAVDRVMKLVVGKVVKSLDLGQADEQEELTMSGESSESSSGFGEFSNGEGDTDELSSDIECDEENFSIED
ncbi:hypothetical protein GQ44DRAFT_395381 [Phaeosphaeriaceae sp. PMI808]|nr:hypothetical protein GQ44DRAFT_395381 [Phaeosphaeriaceae sp. PMI808]